MTTRKWGLLWLALAVMNVLLAVWNADRFLEYGNTQPFVCAVVHVCVALLCCYRAIQIAKRWWYS